MRMAHSLGVEHKTGEVPAATQRTYDDPMGYLHGCQQVLQHLQPCACSPAQRSKLESELQQQAQPSKAVCTAAPVLSVLPLS